MSMRGRDALARWDSTGACHGFHSIGGTTPRSVAVEELGDALDDLDPRRIRLAIHRALAVAGVLDQEQGDRYPGGGHPVRESLSLVRWQEAGLPFPE